MCCTSYTIFGFQLLMSSDQIKNQVDKSDNATSYDK